MEPSENCKRPPRAAGYKGVVGSGEVVNSSDGHSLENGSASRRVGSRNRKEDSFAMTGEGKSSRRGGGGPTSYEKQKWIQKLSSGT